MSIDDAMKFAMQQHEAGQLQQAEAIYRRVLESQPNHPDALHLLGVIASQVNRHDVALELISRAIALHPTAPQYYRNLGRVLAAMGRFDQGIQNYRKSIDMGLADAEVFVLLGSAFQSLGQSTEAIAAFENAIHHDPKYAEAYVFLGNAHHDRGDYESAIDAFRRAIEIRPDMSEAHSNLSISLRCIGQFEQAIAAARCAIEIKPGYFNACNNLATALNSAGRLDESIAVFHDALKISPDSARLHFNLGLTLLLAGQYEQGWREHEWRYRVENYQQFNQKFPHPVWDGRPLTGKRILIHAEQGLGDTIQFSRYVPLIAGRGGRVIFAPHPELARLMHNLGGVAEFAKPGTVAPPFDVHCHLMSLPLIFKTTLTTIPAHDPKLQPQQELIDAWRKRLADERRLKIGLAWAGRPAHKEDRLRSIPLAQFAPLGRAGNDVAFFSLQKGTGAQQAAHPPQGMDLIDWTDELHDFADTAALIENLDLVIAVDTAVAHLAGAMGKCVWVLLPATPDWRWMRDRTDSPWYPTMKLFRQKQPGDWTDAIEEVANSLKSFRIDRDAT